jgi:hypothetical protein
MPPTPKKGSLKKVATAAVKKAKAKIDSTDYTNYNSKVVKPTADSTDYYNYKAKVNFQKASDRSTYPHLRKQFNSYLDKGLKAQKDALRQLDKGRPGYDKDGFPIKKSKVGGIVKSKKK